MAQDPNRPTQPTQKPAPEKKGAVRRVLGAFNPNVDVKNDFRPVGQVFHIFVQILASLFVANRILPSNHPFMARDAKFTINELFHETLVRIDWHDRAKLPQAIFFCAIWGLLASMVLYVVTFVLLFVVSPHQAHAADATTSAGMFTVPDTDLAHQFLQNLVMGDPVTAQDADGKNITLSNTGPIQSAFRSMLEFYSTAILILATFMLIYHIIMLIVNAAWTGKPLEGANQLWGPLRLVIAIGLLVPLSGGLNSGQYLVLKIADMGSALGTNAWHRFTSTLTNGSAQMAVPDNDAMDAEFAKMIAIYVCMADINLTVGPTGNQNDTVISATDVLGSVGDYNAKKFIRKSQVLGNECGTIKLRKAPLISIQSNSSSFSRFMLATPMKQATSAIVTSIAAASVELDEAAKKIGTELATKQTNYQTNSGELSQADLDTIAQEIRSALDAYKESVRKGITSAMSGTKSWDYMKSSSWIIAGGYFMQLASFQHSVLEATRVTPIATPGPVFYRQKKADDGRPGKNNVITDLSPGKDVVATAYEQHFLDLLPFYTRDIDAYKNVASKALGSAADSTATSENSAFWKNIHLDPKFLISIFKNNMDEPFMAFINAGGYILTIGFTLLITSVAVLGASAAGAAIPLVGDVGIVTALIAQTALKLSTVMIGIGMLIGVMMPLVPVTKFLGGVVSWMLAVLEAVIGMPLFALAHLTPGGNGLLDPARHGYIMLLHIALRPILLIFGMIAAIIVISLALFGLNMMFVPAVDSIWSGGEQTITLMFIPLFFVWAFTAYSITKSVFGYMDHVTHKTMDWLGKGAYKFERGNGEAHALASYAAVQQGLTMASGVADGVAGMGSENRKAVAAKKAEEKAKKIAEKQGGSGSPVPGLLAAGGAGAAGGAIVSALNHNDERNSGSDRYSEGADAFSNIGKEAGIGGARRATGAGNDPDRAAGFRSAPQSGGGKGSLQMGSPTGPSDHDLYDSRIAAGKDNESHYNALGVDAFASADKVNEGFAAKAASLAPENFVNKTPEQRNAAQAQLQNLENSRDTLLGSGLHRTADGGLSKAGLGNNMSSGFNSLPESPAIATSGNHVRGVADGKSGGGASGFLKGFGARRTAGAVAVAGGLGLAAGGAMGGGSQAQAAPMTPPTVAGASQPAPANYTTAASSASTPPPITVGLNATPQAASGSFGDRASTGSGDLHSAGDTAAGGGHFGGEQGQSQHNDAGGVGFADSQDAAGGQPTAPAGGYEHSGDTGQAPQIADAAPALSVGTEQQSSAGDNHAADAGDVAALAPLAAAEPAAPAPVSPLSSTASGERAPDLRIDTSGVTSSTEGAPKITISGTPPAPQGAPVQQASQQSAFIAPNPAVQHVTGGRPKQTEQGRAQPVQPIGRNNNKDNGGKDKA